MNNLQDASKKCKSAVTMYWQQRNKNEQILLTATVGLVLFILTFFLLVAPAMSGRRSLRTSLPLLRVQASELQQLLTRAKAMKSPAERTLTPITQSALENRLKRDGLSSKSIVVSGARATVEFDATSFDSIVQFLLDTQTQEGWEVSEATFNTASEPGLVDASITLWQKNM